MPRTPNIVFNMTGQYRTESLPCHGNAYVRTPALDALAAEK